MKTIRLAMLATALTMSGVAAAQTKQNQALRSDLQDLSPAVNGEPEEASVLAKTVMPIPTRTPARLEKTFGPDLMDHLFAPVGVIVAPINRGLRAADTAMAPVYAPLLPVTGPLDPKLFGGRDEPPVAAVPASTLAPRK